jgi:branched-chain amino acid transport system substrate-binding protein
MHLLFTSAFRRKEDDMRYIATTVAALSVLTTAVVIAPARADNEIIVGMAVAQTGFMNAYDDNPTKMAQIFIDDINAKGGLLGRKLKAVIADTKTDRAEAAKVSQDLLRQGADIILAVCDYDFAAPAMLQAQKAGKISISLCAGDPKAGVLGIGSFAFSAGTASQVSGATMAEWAYEKKGWHSIYVLLDDTLEYTKSMCAGFDWMYNKKGGKVPERDTFKNGDASIAAQITRIRTAMAAQKIDALMVCSYVPGAGSAIRQIRAAGIDLPILTGDGLDGTYWLGAVPNLSNLYVVTLASVYGDDPRPDVVALTERYKAKFGDGPVTQFAYPIYAALQLWAKAVTQANSLDAAKVVPIMNSYHDQDTIIGVRTYTDKLHTQNSVPYLIAEVENGKGSIVDKWTISTPVPLTVLYRTGKE